MAIRATGSVTIERPIEEVYDFFSDMENSSLWGRTDKTTKLTDGPISVGTTFREESTMFGRSTESTSEVVVFEPPTKFSFTMRMGEGREVRASVTFSAAAEGTTVSTSNEGEMGNLADKLSPLMGWIFSRQIRSGFKKLKDTMESESTPGA